MAHALGVEPPARIRSTARFRLRTTHRCPAPLVGLATRVRDGDASPIPEAEIEALRASLTVVRMPRGASEERRRATLEVAVEAGLEQESVGPEDLAIVSLAPARSSRIAAIEALGSRPLRSAVDAPEEGSLLADSVLRLKGLERPIVVLTDLDRVVDHASERVLYLALTRASSQCVLVVAEGDADGHAALREVVARLG
jgi:hypothetical protein